MYDYLLKNYIIDIWTIGHILFWAISFFIITTCFRLKQFKDILKLGLISAFAWECLENNIEIVMGFREPFLNRWVTDPIADLLGSFLGFWLNRLVRKKKHG